MRSRGDRTDGPARRVRRYARGTLMGVFATLLTATGPAQNGFSWVQVITVIIVFAVLWPLQSRLRRSISERRRERWEAEGRGSGPGDPDHRE